MSDFVSAVNNVIISLNTSKYFAGIMMLLMNLGSRYISLELTEMHEKILNHKIMRRLLVFVLVFYATRDIKVAFFITAAFVVIISGIFNEDSKFCLLPNTLIINKKKVITKEQYMVAQEIVNKYQNQQNNNPK
jgi:hypothetical protein